jgi:hypothetical protein
MLFVYEFFTALPRCEGIDAYTSKFIWRCIIVLSAKIDIIKLNKQGLRNWNEH